MPNIQVDLDRDLYEAHGDELSAAIHQAQIDALGVPADDLFQVFHPHAPGEIRFDPTYGGVDRQRLVQIKIVMVHMHSVKAKQRLYAALVEQLGRVGVRAEDILIAVIENGFEDWYAGKL